MLIKKSAFDLKSGISYSVVPSPLMKSPKLKNNINRSKSSNISDRVIAQRMAFVKAIVDSL